MRAYYSPDAEIGHIRIVPSTYPLCEGIGLVVAKYQVIRLIRSGSGAEDLVTLYPCRRQSCDDYR
jgi:hypothetical protein